MPPVLAWIQEELRLGALRPVVARFIKEQPEQLDASLVLVETVTVDKIVCRIPFCICDHENLSPSRSEITFTIDPFTGAAVRLG